MGTKGSHIFLFQPITLASWMCGGWCMETVSVYFVHVNLSKGSACTALASIEVMIIFAQP